MVAVTVQHVKTVTIGAYTGQITVGNSSGGTTTANATDLVLPTDWNSIHSASVNLMASDLSGILAGAFGIFSTTNSSGITFGEAAQEYYEPFPLPNTNSTVSAPGIGTWYFDPFSVAQPLKPGQINQFLSCGAVFSNGVGITGSSSGSYSLLSTIQQRLAIYSQNSTNLSQIVSFSSASADWMATNYVTINTSTNSTASISVFATVSVPTTVNNSGLVSYQTFTGSGSTTLGTSTTTASTALNSLYSASGNAAAYISGSIMNVYGFSTSLAPGNYFMAHMFSSSTSSSGAVYAAAGTVFSTQSVLGLLENNIAGYKSIGVTVSNTSSQAQLFHGFLATTTTAPIGSINSTDMRYTTGRMYFNFNQLATT